MSSLVGLISHAPMTGGSLFSLADGNDSIPRAAISATGASGVPPVLHLNTPVALVLFNPHDKMFTLYDGDDRIIGAHDAVVIAAPMQGLGIDFKTVSPWDTTVIEELVLDLPEREVTYVTTVVTLVYAPNGCGDCVTSSTLYTCPSGTCDDTPGGINTISLLHSFGGDYRSGKVAGVFKLFSDRKLGEGELGKVFGEEFEVLREQVRPLRSKQARPRARRAPPNSHRVCGPLFTPCYGRFGTVLALIPTIRTGMRASAGSSS